MGKKKWTPPSERRHHHQRKGGNQKRPFANKHRDGPREPFKPRPKNNERSVYVLLAMIIFCYLYKIVFDLFFSQQQTGPKSGLVEKDVGITQFVGTAPGFTGVIKARFSDFQVNEIDVDGNEVKLTDTVAPKPPQTGEYTFF